MVLFQKIFKLLEYFFNVTMTCFNSQLDEKSYRVPVI